MSETRQEAEQLRLRREYLLFLADRMNKERQIWSDDPDTPGVVPEGTLWVACKEMVEGFSVGMLPASCRDLAVAVAEFKTHWDGFVEFASRTREEVILPSGGFWRAADQIYRQREAAKPRKVKMLEYIPDLVSTGVLPHQIAEIYEWFDEDGCKDLVKVQDAIAHPEKYEHERLRGARSKQERLQEEMEARLARFAQREQETEAAVQPPNVPETVEELAATGVFLSQIADMKGVSREEIIAACQAAGIPIPPESAEESLAQANTADMSETESRRIDAAANYRQAEDEGVTEAAEPIDDELSDRLQLPTDRGLDDPPEDDDDGFGGAIDDSMSENEQILTLQEMGMDHNQIANELGISWQKAHSVMNKETAAAEA